MYIKRKLSLDMFTAEKHRPLMIDYSKLRIGHYLYVDPTNNQIVELQLLTTSFHLLHS